MSATESSTTIPVQTGKRKRNAEPDPEIEIDVNLPEPPSKKALRKAKKQKSSKDSGTSTKETTAKDEEQVDNTTDEKAPAQEEAKTPKRSEYSIWIGNLPWTCDRNGLEAFITVNAPAIERKDITRIHMPAPAPNPREKYNKPLNKGFAYVDFATKENLDAALALSETALGGRKVLIKNSKDFGGRPDPPKEDAGAEGKGRKNTAKEEKPATDRIFVGNLAFEVTKEEITEHFEQCGEVTNVFLATFEDSGKCKGYGWVTFSDIESAKAAERGYVMKQAEPEDSEEEAAPDQSRKAKKPRKWWVNKLHGRPLRCEFAEDASTRYNKRFGKGRRKEDGGDAVGDTAPAEAISEVTEARGPKPAPFRRGKDARLIAPGAAHMNAQRSTSGIVEATGTKIRFD